MALSGRFDMDDLGFNLENDEDNDFCRGYGAATNLNENDAYGTGNEEEDDENDQVPEMPTDFYKNVDSFLSRPPPTLKGSSASSGKKSSKTKESNVPMFPSIHTKQENRMYLPQPPTASESENVPTKKKKNKSTKVEATNNNKRPIDNALLNEAFAYTDRLLREAVIEEQQQTRQQQIANNNNNSNSRAHSTGSIGVSDGKPYQKSDSNNMSVLRKLKSDRQKGYLGSSKGGGGAPAIPKPSAPSDFNVNTGEGDYVDSRRNIVDFDELVANFESGSTLQRLRKELEASQQSLANSQKHMKNITKEFYK